MRKLAPALLAAGFCAAVVWRADVGAEPPPQVQVRQATKAPVSPAPTTVSAQSLNDAVDNYCSSCHNDVDKRGELSLEHFDVARAAQHPQIAEKMIRKLRAGMMPPPGAERPSDDAPDPDR